MDSPPDGDLWENSSNSRAGLYAQCKSIRPDAYLKYHEIHSSVSSSQGDRWEDAQQRRRALHQVILCLLLTAPYEDRFCINKIPRILENSAEDDIDFDVEKVEEAFKELEQYILLIAQSPWKPELHQIKLYNGFYKVKVESRLSRAVDILEIIGFEKTSPDWLQLRTPVNVDWCYKLAFDMFVASAECKLLSSAFRRLVPIGFLPVDIVKGRRYVQGDLDMLETWLVENCKPKSKSHLAKGWDSDRRADTDIVELPIRQHKLTQSGIVRVDSPQRGPIGLESRGSRGRRTVSGYVTEPWSLLRSRAVKAAPFRLTPENYDTPVSQHTSCFEEGTIDDHLAAASLMTMPQEPAKKGLKSSVSMSDEWNYVRDGLIQKYGKSYFQGERGDILADTRRVSSFDEKQERGVDLEALDTERNEAPTLPPRIGKNLTKTSYPYSKPNGAAPLDSRLHVHRPPPLVARGSKPGSGLQQELADVCDGVPVEDGSRANSEDLLVSQRVRMKSSSDVLPSGGAKAAALKSAFFKDKLQDYERLDQKLSFPGDLPDFEHNPSMQTDRTWSCDSCTFRNQISDSVCSMCGKTGQAKAEPSNRPQVRVCQQCTFENLPTAKFCEVCEKCLDTFETEV